MCPPSSAVTHKRATFLPGFVRKIHNSSDGQTRHVDMFIPALRTASGATARRRLQRYDLKRLAPLELAQPKTRVRFSNTIVMYNENIDSDGNVTHDNTSVNIDFDTKKVLPATKETHYCDVQLSADGHTIVSPVDQLTASDDVSKQLADTLSADGTPLSDIHYHDSEDEDDDLHPPAEVPAHTTRAGRRTRAPLKYRDFITSTNHFLACTLANSVASQQTNVLVSSNIFRHQSIRAKIQTTVILLFSTTHNKAS